MPTVKNEPQETKGISLENVNSRADLSEFAQSKGYQVNQGRIPLDFYKKEVNLVNFARAIGYDFSEKTKAPSPHAFARQRWYYMEKESMKFPQLEREENASSKILVGRRSEGPSSKNFRFNEHYYFSQELTHAGDKKNHGSIVDLVQLHFKADFKDSLRIIENFLIKNKELKQGTLSNHVQASSVEASQTKRLESYHNIKPFSNDEFLKSRGISNDTLNHPYFKGRIHNSLSENGNHLNTAFPISSEKGLIGFEIRNKDFKSVEDFKNDGFWRSNVDHSKKVSDLVVNESAIDALSHFQLKNDGKKHFNSLSTQDVYLSSAGSVSGRQIQLLSKMLDKGLSRKNDFLENVPKSSYKDIDQVKEQRTGEGKIVRDENGESVKIASIAYNKPQNLVLAMDNDTSGALLTTKILGRLQTKDYFPKGENPALNNSEISPYMNKKTNVGRISWQIDSDNKSEVKNGVEKINKHFEDLNKKFSDKIVEGKPFEINYSCKEKTGQVDVEFTNNNKNWSLVVDSVKKLKFEDSTRLKIDKPLTKDFNDDLRGKLGVDPILKKRYDLAHSAHEFQMKRQDSKELSKSPGEKKDLSIEEQISRVMDKPSKKGISL